MRIPLIFAIVVMILAVIVDAYIFLYIKRNTSKRLYAGAYGISALLCWAFVLVCILLPRRDADAGITFQMWGFYSFFTIYIPKYIFMIFSLIGGLPRLWKRSTWRTGLWIGLPVAVIAFCAMWWGALFTRRQIEVVNVDVASPNLPNGFDGYKIVQISDLHVGTWGKDTSFVSALCDSINAIRPDVIFFTGDIVNRNSRELQPFLRTLSTLHAKDGIFSVLGNHDYGDYVDWKTPQDKLENLSLLKDWERQIGWKLLNNENVPIVSKGDTIRLIGVENWGEPPFRQYGHLIDAYPISRDSLYNLNDNRYKILLTHNPEHWLREVIDVSNIDLTLSGHTHAMQMELRLGGWKWSPSSFKYSTWGGLYTRKNKDGKSLALYVNIGAGEVGMPFRIGAYPEITVITLRKKSAE